MEQKIITMAAPFVIFLLWQYQAMNEGKEEGMYYACKNKNNILRGLDEHKFWTVQRSAIASGFVSQYLTGQLVYSNGIGAIVWKTIAMAIAYVLVFSYWHNGSLYVAMNKYSLKAPYVGGWKASPVGKAKNDFTYPQRLTMLVAGWAMFILLILTEIL